MEKSTFPGATQVQYALIGGLSIGTALLSTSLVSASIRGFGTNWTMAIGTSLVTLSLLGASYATQIWHLFLSQGVCFGIGMGFLYIPATNALPQWFSSKRSLAVGLSTSGAGLGGLVYNLIAGAGTRTLGLSWTYRILAFCALVVNALCAAVIRDRNKSVKPKQKTLDYHEFARIEVVLLIIWGFMAELGYIVLLYSLPHFAISIGLTQQQGAVIAAMFNLGLALGRPCVGYLSDRFGRINVAGIMTASCGVFCLSIWVPARSYGVLLLFAVLAGIGAGNFWGTCSAVTAEVVGLQRLPTAFGVICLSLAIPTTFAEPIGLELVSSAGYLTSQVFVGLTFLIAAGSTWLLRAWKITEREKAQAEEIPQVINVSRLQTSLRWLAPSKMFKLCRV